LKDALKAIQRGWRSKQLQPQSSSKNSFYVNAGNIDCYLDGPSAYDRQCIRTLDHFTDKK